MRADPLPILPLAAFIYLKRIRGFQSLCTDICICIVLIDCFFYDLISILFGASAFMSGQVKVNIEN